MLAYVKNLIASLSDIDSDAGQGLQQINLTAATLLVEVMMADHQVQEQEIAAVIDCLEEVFEVSPEQSRFLYEQAREQHEGLVSLYELTSHINEQKDQDLKRQIISAMWYIALADGDKDKYEEHLIRKVADLLYVSHSDFIKARLEAQKRYTKAS